ncbi:peptidase [Lonsdalea iberica]|uniref:Peptidase n=1 Tax=Lonsdalea iberica TaxID=1082703 RepID=A0ABX3XCF0_9GAMM|nr:peptidase [Lonsdalea iberica]OSN06365.1 peptidase [Lonsdalea iberica]
MPTRRDFLVMSLLSGAMIAINSSALAQQGIRAKVKGASAITRVFGDGLRLTAVAVEYDEAVSGESLSKADFRVEGRTVTGVFASASANPDDKAAEGHFVIVTLSPDDANAPLVEKMDAKDAKKGAHPPSPGGKGGPGKAGDIPAYDTTYALPVANVSQTGDIKSVQGDRIAAMPAPLTTTKVENLVVDDFQSLTFNDAKTGKTLRYNLFVPKHYDPKQTYPLVLFMHDAGATSDVTHTTLYQGLGAIAWASPADQAQRPAFVLAPQYAEIIADDDAKTSDALDATLNLITSLSEQYNIDRDRCYATGQSGGCMMSIAMNIKYPTFFAASFLVAGQWDPALVKPLARQKLWILVSQDDDKAFPGQNAITEVLKKEGAKIATAVWDGRWSADQFRKASQTIESEGCPINYVSFAKGTVIPPNQSGAGASGHRNTWRIAYTIEPIREWLFRQHR